MSTKSTIAYRTTKDDEGRIASDVEIFEDLHDTCFDEFESMPLRVMLRGEGVESVEVYSSGDYRKVEMALDNDRARDLYECLRERFGGDDE